MSKRLLITGGTGSFGKTVLTSVLKDESYDEVKIFSRDELKQDDLRKLYNDERLSFTLGDVRDKSSLMRGMRSMTEVFSAAAVKQVPSCEFNPMEAVNTNILGTANTIDVAAICGVRRMVVLSTDKAVYPINAMGISKAMMEKIVVSKARDYPELKINVTRYGNVMGSRGSVIPFFLERIKKRQAIPITDGSMTRFMMSLSDAVNLVKFALHSNTTASVYVQKSPAATISTLVEALSLYFERDLIVKEIGIRHGEKIHETLLSYEECNRVVDRGDYYEIKPDERDPNYLKLEDLGSDINKRALAEAYSSENTHRLDAAELLKLLIEAGLLEVKSL